MKQFNASILDIEENIIFYGKEIKAFEKWLVRSNRSDSTIYSYCRTIKHFYTKYNCLSKSNLLSYKDYLIRKEYSPKTINQRINALNKYCCFLNRRALKLSCVKIQNKPFVENVISFNDYNYFIKKLKDDNDMQTYFLVKFIACTGARVSELIQFKYSHILLGYMDIYSKGCKFRRLYIPKKLQLEALEWLQNENITEGLIFKNKNNETIGTTGVSYKLKTAAKRYKKLDINCIYPHSFRHMFAIQFLKKKYDLMLLSDLMGHSSLETTKIYTRMSAAEQAELVNKLVDW